MKQTLLLLCILCATSSLIAQSYNVTGKVKDDNGEPLPGVTVVVKNTIKGTTTGSDGTYFLEVPGPDAILVCSYTGFAQVETPVNGQRTVDITMKESGSVLGEIVVVGYGTSYRQDLTGSISKLNAKEFELQPVQTFENALQGRAAGVFINSGSGKLGQGLNIRVRGISSVSAGNQPLFVIDGIPVISEPVGTSTEPDNPLATIAPEDIESIDILKDAAAAAIYGARASNGVVLVTTKSGRAGRTKVSLGYYGGVSSPTRKREWLNAAEYRELFDYAAKNSDFGELSGAEEFGFETGTDDWNSNNDTNWADEAFQNGGVQNVNLNISGGDARTSFLISGTWNDQTGILVGNALNRLGGRLNLEHKISNRLKIGTNLNLTKSLNQRVPSDNAFTNPLQLNALPPIQPKIDPNTGELNQNTLYYNNLIDLEKGFNDATTYRSISNVYGQWDITDKLYFRTEYGIDWLNLQEDQFNGRETLDGAPTGVSYSNQVTTINQNVNSYFNYSKQFSRNFDLTGTLGMQYQSGERTATSATGAGFPNDRFTKIASAAKILGASSTETAYAFTSYFARVNTKLFDRFLVGLSGRLDGSSRFGKDQRFGFFPAGSVGYILSNESFLQDNKVVNFLKIRASYGRTGNAEIGNFASRTLWGANFVGDLSGIVPTQLGINTLTWENTDQLDIGLDFGLFNDRISATLDYFSKKTNDLLLNLPLPATNGFTIITKNLGSLTNNGWEATLTTQNFVGDFRWSTTFNISGYRNEVTNLNGSTIDGGSRQLGRVSEGEPFGYFYGPQYAGVNPDNGNAQYYDINGNVYDQEDFFEIPDAERNQKIGDPNPDFFGGMNNRFSYKGLTLDVQLQYVYGNDLYNIAGFFQSVNGDYFDNQSRDQLNYWREPGQVTNIPEPRLYSGNGAIKSSRWVQDGSYLRVRATTLSYAFPKAISKRAKMDNLSVYLSGQNLFTFTKYEGYDPEVNATYISSVNLGHDFYTPPQARIFTVGFNATF
jgi:TonB-linked SusC/RagA family outer membrane protein